MVLVQGRVAAARSALVLRRRLLGFAMAPPSWAWSWSWSCLRALHLATRNRKLVLKLEIPGETKTRSCEPAPRVNGDLAAKPWLASLPNETLISISTIPGRTQISRFLCLRTNFSRNCLSFGSGMHTTTVAVGAAGVPSIGRFCRTCHGADVAATSPVRVEIVPFFDKPAPAGEVGQELTAAPSTVPRTSV